MVSIILGYSCFILIYLVNTLLFRIFIHIQFILLLLVLSVIDYHCYWFHRQTQAEKYDHIGHLRFNAKQADNELNVSPVIDCNEKKVEI